MPLAFLASLLVASAQEPITFEQLAERIDPYFAPELVQDVKDVLPQSAFDVWGYDVGDFSGDGANDLALTIRLRTDNRRRVNVYFFVDQEGILQLVKQSTQSFVELPIEVGVSVSNGNAYIARKQSETEWGIEGYRFVDGVIMLVDQFTTTQQGNLTHEEYRNYQTLEGNERYRSAANGEEVFASQFLTIPSYGRGRDVSTGYQATATTYLSKYVLNGSYYWSGDSDLSFSLRSAFDDEYLYFNIMVRDDQVVPVGPAGADTIADRLEIWFDSYTLGNRLRVGKRARDFRTRTDTNIYAFGITLGDLIDKPADIRISTSNLFDLIQTAAAKKIRAVAARADSGYTVKVRIPWALLGFAAPPLGLDSDLAEFGATILVFDVDNPYRPEETTTMASSENFEAAKPATFGALVLVPAARYYGDAVNIYLGEIKERLQEVGF